MTDDASKSIVEEFVQACGLPLVRGAASVRRALWHLRKVEGEPTREDLQAVLPDLRITLTSYMPESEAQACISRGERFLGRSTLQPAADSLHEVRNALRRAKTHLRKSQEFKPGGPSDE